MSNHEKALNNALRAAAQGYAVAPTTINKTPAIPSPHDKGHSCKGDCGQPGHGVYDATTNAADVRRLFGLAPKAVGYLIACSGRLVGLDVDRKNGVDGCATLNRLAREHGFEIPQTTTICTPSGGFHLWMTVPEGVTVPPSVGRLGKGLDVRGTGSYLNGPGSTGRAGEYTFHPRLGYVDPQPVPEQLLKLMLPPGPVSRPQRRLPAQNGAAGRALEGLVNVVLNAPQGERNSKLYWAASKAWAHVGDGHLAAGDVEAELIGAAIQIGLSEAEARRTVASAGRGSGVSA
ncbi:bifunctional DNA primase/polymerase-like protein [Streptomyces sp. Ag82_O1-15]|uniref:bifunctional DNA primase/polymerase n=1 Tax=Streptomyces sp. Ag82_O1-15 TaxID=1938855 RepID=UPI000BB10338|nr:bifunctional DNA primase/polymerase [Streptomyces sp. Ag82_O1-15]PBD00291.1 bifunctional DNA primase/polymerase-like protein [Streptomyces sp. Ag82_O1-15]